MNLTTLLIPSDLLTPMTVALIPHGQDGYDLSTMYRQIGCELVEVVHAYQFPDCLLWCDEEARLRGEPQPNIRASILAGTPIYGNVILSCYRNGRDHGWSPSNPLPFIPCDLQDKAQELAGDPVFQSMLDTELYR
jgi:hypothetical protein